jgi:hypothetical protein
MYSCSQLLFLEAGEDHPFMKFRKDKAVGVEPLVTMETYASIIMMMECLGRVSESSSFCPHVEDCRAMTNEAGEIILDDDNMIPGLFVQFRQWKGNNDGSLEPQTQWIPVRFDLTTLLFISLTIVYVHYHRRSVIPSTRSAASLLF